MKQLDDEKAAHAKSREDITSIATELEACATKAESEVEALTTQLAESAGKQEASTDADAAAESGVALESQLKT